MQKNYSNDADVHKITWLDQYTLEVEYFCGSSTEVWCDRKLDCHIPDNMETVQKMPRILSAGSFPNTQRSNIVKIVVSLFQT